MLIEERFLEIIKIVNDKKTVTVQELTELLDTSESTIRRDLTVLHKNKKLIKVHGGATAIDINYNTKDDDIAVRQDLNREEKLVIAQYAATLIEANDFVFIDAGTTTEAMIDYITEQNAVFVTNAIGHAKKLVQKGFIVHLLGGELKLATEAVVGGETIEALQKYNFTKGFWGTNGVSIQFGFTTPDINEAMVKKKAFEKCKECYILSDATKFNQISSVTFAEFDDAIVITSSVKDSSFKKYENVMEVAR